MPDLSDSSREPGLPAESIFFSSTERTGRRDQRGGVTIPFSGGARNRHHSVGADIQLPAQPCVLSFQVQDSSEFDRLLSPSILFNLPHELDAGGPRGLAKGWAESEATTSIFNLRSDGANTS